MVLETASHDSWQIAPSFWKQKPSEWCWLPSRSGMLYNLHRWSENRFKTEKAAYVTEISLHSSHSGILFYPGVETTQQWK